MKKLLALVLALVMSLSLVTISNAAYSDADKISYDEAVAVMSAVGVLQGDNNTFNPTGKLTREQAAKVIAYLALGEDVAEALPSVQVFDDVAADRWSAKYIAYCAQEGIINGVGNNKFNPTGELTGYAFAKMLFCALGYDANNEGFTGTGWEVKVAQKMNKNDGAEDLSDGVDGSANAALTREEAAQYMLNMIQLPTVVGYDGKGSNITIGDLTISSDPGDAEYGKVYYKANYKKLALTNDEDAFGRATRVWELDGDEVWNDTVDAAEASYTGKVKSADLYKDLGLNKNVTATVTVNGKEADDFVIAKKGDDSKAKVGAVGAIVEVYKDTVDDVDTYSIVVVKYAVDEIDDVTETKYNKDGSVKTDGYVTFVDGAGTYETEEFEEEDIVLVARDAKGDAADVILAESIEGKVSSINKDKEAVIDGTAYALDGESVKVGDKGTFYLGVDGAIVKFDGESTKSDKYAYVYSLVKDTNEYNDEGVKVDEDSYTVYYVDADGVKASAVLAEDEVVVKGKVYAYSINSDGEFEVSDKGEVEGFQSYTKAINKNTKTAAGYYLSSDTEFVFVNVGSKKVTTSVATGYKNVNVKADTESFIGYDDEDMAVIVFVIGKAAELDEEGENFLLDVEYVETANDDDEAVYVFDVMIDGEETEVETKKAAIFADAKVGAGDKFSFEVDSDGYVTKVEKVVADEFKVTKVVEGYVYGGETVYEITDDTVIYKLADVDGYELGAEDNGDVADFTETSKVAKKDVVRVYANDDDEATCIVIIVKD